MMSQLSEKSVQSTTCSWSAEDTHSTDQLFPKSFTPVNLNQAHGRNRIYVSSISLPLVSKPKLHLKVIIVIVVAGQRSVIHMTILNS